MDFFPKTHTYGLRAAMYLALYSSVDHKLGIDDISEALNIPKPFLAKILQKMARECLINSTKGPGGGFYITEEQRGRAALELMNILEGGMAFNTCIMGFTYCNSQNPCALHYEFLHCRDRITARLGETSILNMAKEVTARNSNFRL